MKDKNNLYSSLVNFYNINDENFKEFLAEFYKEMLRNHNDIQYVKEHLKEEIEKKLEDFLVNGGFNVNIKEKVDEFLQNTDVLQNIHKQIDDIETLELINNDLILFASYQSGNLPAASDFTLYVGKDTEKCYPVNNSKILDFVTNKPLWDIACFYENGKFYFIGDYKDSDNVWGGNAFLLIESEDLINFKQTPIKIRSSLKNITQTWAPKFFKDDDGKCYLIYCIQENNEMYTDTNLLNISHNKLKLCYSSALDDTLTSWSEPTYINIGSDECYIDPFIYKLNGVYHLFACYDNNAEIKHFTSQSITGNFELNSVIPFPTVTEAPSVIRFNDKFYMFVDSQRATGGRDSGLIQVMESYDLYTWGNLKTYKNTANTVMRHFAPMVINSPQQKEVIKKLFKKHKLNNNYIESNNSTFLSEKNNISYFDLSSITPKNTKTIEELTVMPYTIYYMNSNIDSITINKINASKLKNFETFSFVLNSFGNSKLTIKNNSNMGAFLPIRRDLVIDGYSGSNIITFTVLDGYIKCHTFMEYEEDNHKFNFVKNGDFKREDLSMFGGMNNYTPTLDESKEYLKLEETGSTLWKGVAQNIQLQPNKKYKVSAVVFIKDNSVFTDGIGLTVKGERSSGGDVELGADYINQANMEEYKGKKMNFIIDTSTINLADYNRFYVYLFLKKRGCIYVKNLKVEYVE